MEEELLPVFPFTLSEIRARVLTDVVPDVLGARTGGRGDRAHRRHSATVT